MAEPSTFFKTVCALLRGDVDVAFDNMTKKVQQNNYSSIAAKASEGILQFPIIVSNSIDYDTAVMASKACERAYASFVNIVFSMNRDMSDADADNIVGYIKRFHDNSLSATVDTGTNGMAKSAQGLVDKAAYLGESFTFEGANNDTYKCTMYVPDKPLMAGELKEMLKPYIENFCLDKLNDKYNPSTLARAAYTVPILEAKGGKGKGKGVEPITRKYTLDDMYDEMHKTRKALEKDKKAAKFNKATRVFLSDSDVKKANELQPVFIKLEVQRSTSAGNVVKYEVTVGVKGTIHPVTSEEFISNMVDACEYKGKLFRFIKWTTGEIGFVRDFVLNMDQFKKETKNRAYGNSAWWEALKRRGREAKLSKIDDNRILPNTTLIFSRAEVDHIKANYGYDLSSKSIAKRLMEEYFLLGYMILDTSTEIATVLYDGQKDFQTLTFRALERENADGARQFSDIMKALRHS